MRRNLENRRREILATATEMTTWLKPDPPILGMGAAFPSAVSRGMDERTYIATQMMKAFAADRKLSIDDATEAAVAWADSLLARLARDRK